MTSDLASDLASTQRAEPSPSTKAELVQPVSVPRMVLEELEAAPSSSPVLEEARPSQNPWRSRKEIIARLSGRILEAQRGINVLQALAWEPEIEERFRATRGRELPKVGREHWDKIELGFQPAAKIDAFEGIAGDIESELGATDPVAQILIDSAIQYADVARMLAARGTPEFHRLCRRLYGSPKDQLFGRIAVRDLGLSTYGLLTRLASKSAVAAGPKDLDADRAAEMLAERFDKFFVGASVQVLVADDVLADAAAGSDYVKVRAGARFASHDVDVLEVHEGWVHVATSLNGQAQPVARWLAKGPPRTVATQEGLAALMEMLTGRSNVRRAQKLNDRILAVDKAEDGASFLDVYEWFRTEGYDEEDCFSNARRVFRGGMLEGGGPFTKDICYGKGLALNFAFVQSAVERGQLELLPLLFVGKISLDDIPVLAQHLDDGLVRAPTYLPTLFKDLRSLTAMMAFVSVLSNGCASVEPFREGGELTRTQDR